MRQLLRLSLEDFLKWEEPSLRSLRPPRFPQTVLANLECLQTSALAESFHQVEQLHLTRRVGGLQEGVLLTSPGLPELES